MKFKGVSINIIGDYDVTLEMLLNEIDDGAAYRWKIFYLELTLKNYENEYVDIWGKAKGKEGYEITWADLKVYSNLIFQLIDGTFIGTQSIDNIELTNPFTERYIKYEYNIEMIDGGIWEIYTNDERFYNRLTTKYKIYKFLDTNNYEVDSKIIPFEIS